MVTSNIIIGAKVQQQNRKGTEAKVPLTTVGNIIKNVVACRKSTSPRATNKEAQKNVKIVKTQNGTIVVNKETRTTEYISKNKQATHLNSISTKNVEDDEDYQAKVESDLKKIIQDYGYRLSRMKPEERKYCKLPVDPRHMGKQVNRRTVTSAYILERYDDKKSLHMKRPSRNKPLKNTTLPEGWIAVGHKTGHKTKQETHIHDRKWFINTDVYIILPEPRSSLKRCR